MIFMIVLLTLSRCVGFSNRVFDDSFSFTQGRRWWATAGDPWQCLATCIELHAALESPNPYEFESSLPVHQDGTCNGLQHYAALGGDAQGAQQVNLASGDRPSDVYTHVGDMVERLLKVDVDKGHKYAKMLQGKISRKVVKQTVSFYRCIPLYALVLMFWCW